MGDLGVFLAVIGSKARGVDDPQVVPFVLFYVARCSLRPFTDGLAVPSSYGLTNSALASHRSAKKHNVEAIKASFLLSEIGVTFRE
ncbi:hypothetical protein D3C84_807930 [compost metagenome]